MNKEWFRDAVSGKPQTLAYLLPRMALTMSQPHHGDVLRYSCHQQVASAIRDLHNNDKLESDHAIVFFGTDSMVWHSILVKGDAVICDLIGEVPGNVYDPVKENYHSGTFKGSLPVKLKLSVDDFFSDYVAKLNVTPNRNDSPEAPALR